MQDLGPVSLPHELSLNFLVSLTVSLPTPPSEPWRAVHREYNEFLVPTRPNAELAVSAVNRGRAAALVRRVKEEHRVDTALQGHGGEGREARTP